MADRSEGILFFWRNNSKKVGMLLILGINKIDKVLLSLSYNLVFKICNNGGIKGLSFRNHLFLF